MEFIKHGKNYLIKNSNGKIVSEKEMLELQNRELIIEDINSNGCQGKTTKKISKNKKRIKEIDNEYEKLLEKKKVELFNKDLEKINIGVQPLDSKKIVKYIKEQTALEERDGADGTIEETSTIN